MTDATNPTISMRTVVLDTDDPPRLAEFYRTMLGWQITDVADDWITITDRAGTRMAFQLAIDHRPPTWPDNAVPQQLHLDLTVEDLEAASAYVESIGARPIDGPEDSPDFRVFLDPSGHPFCLCV